MVVGRRCAKRRSSTHSPNGSCFWHAPWWVYPPGWWCVGAHTHKQNTHQLGGGVGEMVVFPCVNGGIAGVDGWSSPTLPHSGALHLHPSPLIGTDHSGWSPPLVSHFRSCAWCPRGLAGVCCASRFGMG